MRKLHSRLLASSLVLLANSLFAAPSSASELPNAVSSAIAEQKVLITEEPYNADAYNDLGNLLLLAREPGLAEEAYRRAAAIDDQLISAHFNLGLLLAQKGDTEEARQQFDQVLSLDPEHAWSHFQIGRLSEEAGKTDRALKAYIEAFRLDPSLSFSDLNPQVVDSRLTTRALLSIDSGLASASEAPRAYQDPFRIASLLLPKLPEDESNAEKPVAEEMETSPAAPNSDRDLESSETKTLRTGDLDPNSSIGEADPPAVTTRRGGNRTNNRRNPRTQPPATITRPSTSSGHIRGRPDRSAPNIRSTGQVRTRTLPN